ncbi:MAG: nitroreductase [Candidatus Methanomethylicota archaeon]|nr:MAG: nitroreductase [Candidatus Verstraetearchaeota archaeon]
MSVYESILRRRSIRTYLDKPLEYEKLKILLNAARWAPSARNLQPWHLIIVLDGKLKERLVNACRRQRFVGEASAIIVGLADMELSPKWAVVDTTIALEHVVLAACDLGLGTCWIGAFDEEAVKSLLNIPRRFKVVALLTVGYPAEKPSARSRRPISQIYSINCYGSSFKPIK